MKKLITFLLMVITIDLSAQTIAVDPDNTVWVNTTGSPYRVISQVNATDPPLPAKQDTSKRTTIWLEPGDGFFSTTPSEKHRVLSDARYSPFLLATNLYDTGKGGVDKTMPSRVLVSNRVNVNRIAATVGGFTQTIREDVGVHVQSNTTSIVPGDTMVFAITYKTISNDPVPPNYKLYFFYNDNATFIPLAGNENLVADLPFVRLHNAESIFQTSATSFSDDITRQKGFTDRLGFNIGTASDKKFEHTVFISMVPKANLTYGESGSVYAVITDESNNRIASDSIGKMLFARAHDPNYLVQLPTCIDLPKRDVPLSYHIHFQNTGDGPANEVKLRIHLPEGLNWSTFKLESAFYAGNKYPVSRLETIPADPRTNQTDDLVIIFKSTSPDHSDYLQGRTAWQPATNPCTMGDVFFSITATSRVKDNMQAYANIDFMSVHPVTPGVYEDAVRTNTATTVYKEHCKDCNNCPNPCYKILGLCWWWWLIILAIIIIIIIIKRRRKKLQAC